MRKIIVKTSLLFVLVYVSTSFQSKAQLSAEDLKAQLIKDWERGKDYTISYLNTNHIDP